MCFIWSGPSVRIPIMRGVPLRTLNVFLKSEMAHLKSYKWMSLSYNFQTWGLSLDTPITQKGSPTFRSQTHCSVHLTWIDILFHVTVPCEPQRCKNIDVRIVIIINSEIILCRNITDVSFMIWIWKEPMLQSVSWPTESRSQSTKSQLRKTSWESWRV